LDRNFAWKAYSSFEGIADGYDASCGGAGMKFFRLLRAILREIFDEGAYERFCLQEQLEPGQKSYSKFLNERDRNIKVSCC
jgi:hypothetical protein